MKTTLAVIGLCVITACIVGCGERLQASHLSSLKELILISSNESTVSLQVEVASEPKDHVRGLMFREELPEEQGMLFVFEEPRVLSFWMKNTIIPLDVMFFDADGQFISFETMIPCEKDPCKQYSSEVPAVYALEVNSGFTEEQGIGDGWKMALSR